MLTFLSDAVRDDDVGPSEQELWKYSGRSLNATSQMEKLSKEKGRLKN